MKVVVQRVKHASCTIDGNLYSSIEQGYLLLVGFTHTDSIKEVNYLAKKIAGLRIFEDENGKMNLSVQDISGSALVISQFTLAGDCTRGNRPGFDQAAHPDIAKPMYEYFSEQLRNENIKVENGIFQADMQVSLINDGPVTFILEK